MFVTSSDYLAEVKKLVQVSERLDIAVAFWGEGSDALIVPATNRAARIICNLSSGGTNPTPIRKLIELGFVVKQQNDLHAKVILSTDVAIVGSANLSTNGLQLEGGESAGWSEAGVLVTTSEELRDIARWFEAEWSRAREITTSHLDSAEAAWLLRRKARPKLKQAKSLFDLAPSEVRDRGVYILIWSDDASEGAYAAHLELVSKAEEDGLISPEALSQLSFYEDLGEVPQDAILISFKRHGNGKFSCDGVWLRVADLDQPANEVHRGLQIVKEIHEVQGVKIGARQRRELEKKLGPLLENLRVEFEGNYSGAIIPLDAALSKLK